MKRSTSFVRAWDGRRPTGVERTRSRRVVSVSLNNADGLRAMALIGLCANGRGAGAYDAERRARGRGWVLTVKAATWALVSALVPRAKVIA